MSISNCRMFQGSGGFGGGFGGNAGGGFGGNATGGGFGGGFNAGDQSFTSPGGKLALLPLPPPVTHPPSSSNIGFHM